jgi:hypothetical protein
MGFGRANKKEEKGEEWCVARGIRGKEKKKGGKWITGRRKRERGREM